MRRETDLNNIAGLKADCKKEMEFQQAIVELLRRSGRLAGGGAKGFADGAALIPLIRIKIALAIFAAQVVDGRFGVLITGKGSGIAVIAGKINTRSARKNWRIKRQGRSGGGYIPRGGSGTVNRGQLLIRRNIRMRSGMSSTTSQRQGHHYEWHQSHGKT